MNDFEAAVTSLGEHVVDMIGKDHLVEVVVAGDELTATAEVSITLRDQTWAEQERAIDKMVEVRSLFFDELSIDYQFTYPGDTTRAASAKADHLIFS